LEEFNGVCRSHGIHYSRSKFWNGDDWLVLMIKSPFILADFNKGNAGNNTHISIWNLHLEYFRILLQEKISNAEVDEALEKCKRWRRLYKAQYPTEANKPNFHAILHSIEDIKSFGPPVITWTRPFEHQHKVFRQMIDDSNHKNLEVWCMQRLEEIRTLDLIFPFLRKDRTVISGSYQILRAGQYVQIRLTNNNVFFARVTKTSENGVNLTIFKENWTPHPFIPQSPKLSSLQPLQTLDNVPYKAIYKKMWMTKYQNEEYLNPFAALNFAKFAIPEQYSEISLHD